MNHVVTEGIVLRRTNYGEADRIVTVLTAKAGKISAMARGVRRLNSKLAAGLELLSLNQFNLIKGKTDLYTIGSARPIAVWERPLSDYDLLQDIYGLMKFIDQHTEVGEGQPEFELLLTTLGAINEQKNYPPVALVWFYLRFLLTNGRQPDLKHDNTGQLLDEKAAYTLDPDEGRLLPSTSGNITSRHIIFWRLCLTNDLDVALKVGGADKVAESSLEPIRQFADTQLR